MAEEGQSFTAFFLDTIEPVFMHIAIGGQQFVEGVHDLVIAGGHLRFQINLGTAPTEGIHEFRMLRIVDLADVPWPAKPVHTGSEAFSLSGSISPGKALCLTFRGRLNRSACRRFRLDIGISRQELRRPVQIHRRIKFLQPVQRFCIHPDCLHAIGRCLLSPSQG